MIQFPTDIASQFPVRKSRKQKKEFRQEVMAYGQSLGYECKSEKIGLNGENIIIGNPKTAKHLITAHYDTCAALPVPNFITPCNFWLYLLYQILITVALLAVIMALAVGISMITDSVLVRRYSYCVICFIMLFLMLYGPANKHNANDNTSGVVTALEIAGALPEQYRDKVCFVLFDLEEAGLVGSSAYRTAHKNETNGQIVWNFDCVGDGDEIMFFPKRRVKRNPAAAKLLEKCHAASGDKRVSVCEGFYFYPSDQSNFPGGIGIAAMRRGRLALYVDKIHTAKDTVLEMDNVNLLRDTMLAVIAADE